MKHSRTVVIMLLLSLLITACGNKKAQSKKYYRLQPPSTTEAVSTRPQMLVIKRPTALSILGGRPMVATQSDGSLIQLSHNFWLESPKVLLQDSLKSWAANQWQQVSLKVPSNDDYLVLETRILAFEKNQNQAKIALEFSLLDHDSQLLFNQQFEHHQPLAETGGFRAFAQAMSQGIDVILKQLTTQLTDVE